MTAEPGAPDPVRGLAASAVYPHVHPDEDSLAFTPEFPTEGRYRLYPQFKHQGAVHTAELTQDVSR
jgi:hypothetical protein